MSDLYVHLPYTYSSMLMETAKTNKNERLDLRVSAKEKVLFRAAQQLSGDSSISSFIVRIVKEQAEQIVAKSEQILASERDRKIFFDAVFGASAPNQNLKNAADRFLAKKSG